MTCIAMTFFLFSTKESIKENTKALFHNKRCVKLQSFTLFTFLKKMFGMFVNCNITSYVFWYCFLTTNKWIHWVVPILSYYPFSYCRGSLGQAQATGLYFGPGVTAKMYIKMILPRYGLAYINHSQTT